MGCTIFQADAGQTTDVLEAQDSTGRPYFNVGGPVLPGDSIDHNFLRLDAPFPPGAANDCVAAYLDLDTTGTGAHGQYGLYVAINPGYTGSGGTGCARFYDTACGTGNTFGGTSGSYGYRPGNANEAVFVTANGTTTGSNIGLLANAKNGNFNVPLWATATGAKAGAVNAAVAAFALNTGGGGAVHCAGFFALADYGTSAPPIPNAALVADNGATADPIARFRVNGVDQVVIDQNGGIVLARMADATAAGGTLYFSTDAGKLVYKDSGGTVNPLY